MPSTADLPFNCSRRVSSLCTVVLSVTLCQAQCKTSFDETSITTSKNLQILITADDSVLVTQCKTQCKTSFAQGTMKFQNPLVKISKCLINADDSMLFAVHT